LGEHACIYTYHPFPCRTQNFSILSNPKPQFPKQQALASLESPAMSRAVATVEVLSSILCSRGNKDLQFSSPSEKYQNQEISKVSKISNIRHFHVFVNNCMVFKHNDDPWMHFDSRGREPFTNYNPMWVTGVPAMPVTFVAPLRTENDPNRHEV